MKFSKRTGFGAGEPNALTKLLSRKRETKSPVLDLTEFNPTRCYFQSLNEAVLEPLRDSRNLVYDPDPRGLLSAREAVVRYYAEKNISLHPDQIFLTAGTSEAYSHCFHLLCDPGESVLRMTPGYPLLDSLASLSDIRLESCAYIYDGHWRLDREAFQKSLHPAIRACVLVNPANPTGNYISEEDGVWLESQGSSGELAMISDEVFFDFDREKKPRRSMAAPSEALTITLSGISKILGLPQMKLSWMVVQGPKKARAEACTRLDHILDAYLSVAAPAQHALDVWFMNLPSFTTEVRNRVLANRTILEDAFAGHSTVLTHVQGGWCSILKLDEALSEEAVALTLLDKENVLVYPGYFFDFEWPCLVISLLPEKKIFDEAVRRLRRCLPS